MEVEILNMISNASINGYYDPSLGLVVVWFHNSKEDKSDLVAYLQQDMKWDLRKVLEEKSILYDSKEVIEINHEVIGVFESGSTFDDTVRSVLKQVIDHAITIGDVSTQLEMMKMVLDNNYYSVKD